jgi:hypothetical protein
LKREEGYGEDEEGEEEVRQGRGGGEGRGRNEDRTAKDMNKKAKQEDRTYTRRSTKRTGKKKRDSRAYNLQKHTHTRHATGI